MYYKNNILIVINCNLKHIANTKAWIIATYKPTLGK